MIDDLRMPPIPPQIRDRLAVLVEKLPPDPELRFRVRAAVRQAYSAGYDDGMRDGERDGREDLRAELRAAEGATP